MLILVVPPEPALIEPLGAGSYAAPAMWDDEEWASPTPCCLEWVMRRSAALEIEGRLDLVAPSAGRRGR
jgi:hypothetical protein